MREQIANMIDYTLLRPNVTDRELEKFCKTAEQYKFKTVAVNSVAVKKCVQFLQKSVIVGAAIGFPLGQSSIDVKTFETIDAINNGAGEIDYVINIAEVKNRNWDYVTKEMESIVYLCKEKGVCVKAIFETCYLDDEEIVKLCKIANKIKPDYIKTSTGFGTAGATIHHVKLMRAEANCAIKIKAAGGIRDRSSCEAFIKAGAERIGTSAGCEIIDAFSVGGGEYV